MHKTYTIKINTRNAAFQDGYEFEEVARILRELANKLEVIYTPRECPRLDLRDINGNTVGHAEWTTR